MRELSTHRVFPASCMDCEAVEASEAVAGGSKRRADGAVVCRTWKSERTGSICANVHTNERQSDMSVGRARRSADRNSELEYDECLERRVGGVKRSVSRH